MFMRFEFIVNLNIIGLWRYFAYPEFQRPLEKRKTGPLVPRGIQLFYAPNSVTGETLTGDPHFYSTIAVFILKTRLTPDY